MSGKVTINTPIIGRVVELIVKRPGIGRPEIAEVLGVSKAHLIRVLTFARSAGMIEPVQLSRTRGGWFTPELAKQQKEEMMARADDRKRERLAAVRESCREKALRAEAEHAAKMAAQEALDEMPIVRRVLAAGSTCPLPFVCKAPASVFHLGGML
jgi:hypothetical protein